MNRRLMGTALVCLLGILAPQAAQALDRHVLFQNDYHRSITQIYATNVKNSGWGRNLLRSRIAPGDSAYLDLNDRSGYCIYDVKVVARDGAVDQRKFNACSETTLYFAP